MVITDSLFLLLCRLAKTRELSERVSHHSRLVTMSDPVFTKVPSVSHASMKYCSSSLDSTSVRLNSTSVSSAEWRFSRPK